MTVYPMVNPLQHRLSISTTDAQSGNKVFAFIKGKSPATVNPALWRQAQLNNNNGLFKITDGVYQVRSFDVANISFIETKTGYVVIDALTVAESSAAAYELVKKHVGDKPILAVIVTHSHGDHYGGAAWLQKTTKCFFRQV